MPISCFLSHFISGLLLIQLQLMMKTLEEIQQFCITCFYALQLLYQQLLSYFQWFLDLWDKIRTFLDKLIITHSLVRACKKRVIVVMKTHLLLHILNHLLGKCFRLNTNHFLVDLILKCLCPLRIMTEDENSLIKFHDI